MELQLTPQKTIYDFCEPYIIAELGSNHNGDMDLARKLIVAAKEAGADCVKFQSWSKETIFSRKTYDDNYFIADDYRNRTDFTLEQIVDKFAISPQDLKDMAGFAREVGIDCTSTPFSRAEADFLMELDVPFIKIASMDCNNYPFLEYLAGLGKPLVLSTGLSNLSEIDRAVRTIEAAGNTDLVILHCLAVYPAPETDVNLNNMDTFRRIYPYPVGFSDHTRGTSIPLAAVAKGAAVIEKHFTLDKEMFGWDHKVSADPEEMAELTREAKRVWAALGSPRIQVPENQERIRSFRRSIVAARAIKKGEVFTEEMIDYKRPAEGLAPEYRDFILGRTARRDIPYDQIIREEDF